MKSLLILFGLIFCLVSVSGRNIHENLGNEEFSEDDPQKHAREPNANQMRHRRRSRQSYPNYNYYDSWRDQRDHYRQQDESYNQIIRLLDEIAFNLRRPAPPPPAPPVYVPYPVPYYVPQYIGCSKPSSNANKTFVPELTLKWPDMEDERQNFGLVPEETDNEDSDGIRPVSFDAVPPAVAAKPPPVDHGSSQAGVNDKKTPVKRPGICKAAVLTCCNLKSNQEQRSCFAKHDCSTVFKTGLACRPEVVNKALQEFAEAYAPVTDF